MFVSTSEHVLLFCKWSVMKHTSSCNPSVFAQRACSQCSPRLHFGRWACLAYIQSGIEEQLPWGPL